jgi:multiple sugar transport system substrate-binding protein
VTLGYGYDATLIDRIWMNMLAEVGKSLYTEAFDQITIAEDEEIRKIVQYYFDLAKEKVTLSPQNPSPHGWYGSDFTAGMLAVVQFGYWFSAMAEADANRGSVIMLPAPTWAGFRRDPAVSATGMVMTSATQVADSAWRFFEWYNGGQPSVDRARSGWNVPALKSQVSLMPQNTDLQKQAFKVLTAELALKTTPIQFNPFIGETTVSDAWTKNLSLALAGSLTFDGMFTNIASEVNTTITENIDRFTS